MRGQDNGDFLFSKILINCFTKRVTGELFDYNEIVSEEENNKKEDLVHSNYSGIFFCINFLLKEIFKGKDSSKLTGTLDIAKYGIY